MSQPSKKLDKLYTLLDKKLNIFVDKLDIVVDRLDSVVEESQNIGSQLDTFKATIVTKIDDLNTAVSSVGTSVDQLNCNLVFSPENPPQENVSTIMTEIKVLKEAADATKSLKEQDYAIRVEDHAYKRKGTMKKFWYGKLNFLAQKYEQYMTNKVKSDQYEEWAESKLFLPKKFRTHKDEMSEEERETATKKGFEKMKEEMTKMKSEAAKARKKAEEVDQEMKEVFRAREVKNVWRKNGRNLGRRGR